MSPPNLTVPDFHSRAVGGVVVPYRGVRMTRTPDCSYEVDNHSSLDTTTVRPPNLTAPDFDSRAVGGVVGRFNA
jgi:hypothetical protein